jgi:hypothetical protein
VEFRHLLSVVLQVGLRHHLVESRLLVESHLLVEFRHLLSVVLQVGLHPRLEFLLHL